MVWSDKPTDAQLYRVYSWIRWEMTNEQAQKAIAWLEETATRRDVSLEMTRLKELKEKRLLDGKNCFESQIWEGFKHE